MDQNFAESMHLLGANAFSAALPGVHALGRVHSPHAVIISTWLVKTEMLSTVVEQPFIEQCRGKSWRKGVNHFPEIFSQNR